jgi:hypothetical protein
MVFYDRAFGENDLNYARGKQSEPLKKRYANESDAIHYGKSPTD